MGRAALFATSGLVVASLCFAPAPGLAGSPASAPAKHWVRAELRHRHLKPELVACHGGSNWHCFWRATRAVGGWTFSCRGHAQRSAGRSRLGRCRLQGPRLAPMRAAQSLGNWQPDFGFNDDWLTVFDHVDLAGGAGSNTSRVPLRWELVEPTRGHYNWNGYDQIYNAMVYRGIKPILALDGAPCWARPATPCVADSHYPPAARYYDQWARFIQLVVRRYPKLEGVEVWNEPNLNAFWQPAPDPIAYTNLLKVSYKAVKSVAPTVPVIFAGLVPQFVPSERAMSVKTFQRRAYRAGAGRYTDAFGVHPYVFPNNDPNLYVGVLRQMAIPKGIMARFGYPATPEWVTEFGISTRGAGAVSEADQATKIVGLYGLLRSIPSVPVLILHRLLDLGPDSGDWQAGMGVATYKGALKPSYCALSDARIGFCPY